MADFIAEQLHQVESAVALVTLPSAEVIRQRGARRARRRLAAAGAACLLTAGVAAGVLTLLPGPGTGLHYINKPPSPAVAKSPTASPSPAASGSPVTSPSPTSPTRPSKRVNFAGVTFILPTGWAVSQGEQVPGIYPGSWECAGPVHPAANAPIWSGCAGLMVEDYPVPPTGGFGGISDNPGYVWFRSSGTLPCPVSSENPANQVGAPGPLTGQKVVTVGDVSYRWYQWSATCVLNGTPGPTITYRFNPQVWWLSKPGVAIVDVTGVKAQSLLASVQPAP